jgi:hypothetical protein
MNQRFLVLLLLAFTVCRQTQANAPQIDTSNWQKVTIPECGIRLRLPKRYAEAKDMVKVGDYVGRSYRDGMFTIEIEARSSVLPQLSDNKIIRQSDYSDYTESTDMIGGQQAIVQCFRANGNVNGSEPSLYHAGAIWQLGSGKILSIAGWVESRESQSEIVAVLHTVEFLP